MAGPEAKVTEVIGFGLWTPRWQAWRTGVENFEIFRYSVLLLALDSRRLELVALLPANEMRETCSFPT
jgi:hypothetical protein